MSVFSPRYGGDVVELAVEGLWVVVVRPVAGAESEDQRSLERPELLLVGDRSPARLGVSLWGSPPDRSLEGLAEVLGAGCRSWIRRWSCGTRTWCHRARELGSDYASA